MIILGTDPGLDGAIALIDSATGLRDVLDIPTSSNGTASGSMRRQVDASGLVEALIEWRRRHEFAREAVHGVIERPIPMPSLPAQTIASQFDTFGVLRAVMAALGWPVAVVEPARWKKTYTFGTDKNGARATCLRLYPAAPVTLVKHHNRAEAILIGHWYLQQHEGDREARALDWAGA